MLYPRRDRALTDRELAVAAALLFAVSALLIALGGVQGGLALFALAMGCQALRPAR